MLRNATMLAEQVVANATAALIDSPSTLRVYSVPAIPPASEDSSPAVCATHGCAAPTEATCSAADGQNYTDCAGHGNPGLPGGNSKEHCNARGCCWQQSSAHSWCYLPRNERLHPAPPPAHVPDWPEDGTVLRLPPSGQRLPLIASNPLGWNRSDVLSVRVLSASAAMSVTDASGQLVLAQLAPPEPVNASVTSHAALHVEWAKWASGKSTTTRLVMSRLLIRVELLPLGSSTLFLSAVGAGDTRASSVAISSVKIGDGKTRFTTSNAAWSLAFSPAGLLDAASENGPGAKTLRLRQDIMMYLLRQTFLSCHLFD